MHAGKKMAPDRRPPSTASGQGMTRRSALMALSGSLLGGIRLNGQTRRPGLPTIPLVATRTLNHVALRVANAKRSVEFYQRVLGMPIHGYQKNGNATLLTIGAGPQFLSIVEGPDPHLIHYGFGVEDFDAERTRKILADKGIKARVEMRRGAEQRPAGQGDTPELMVTDSEGVEFKLVDMTSCGGTGALGNICSEMVPAPRRAGDPPPIPVRTLNHTAMGARNMSRCVRFYVEAMGLFVQTTQSFLDKEFVPILGVGRGPSFVAVYQETSPTPKVSNHICFGIEYTGASAASNVDRLIKTLALHGVKGSEIRLDAAYPFNNSEGVMFPDPDGFGLQFVNVRYCGGGGELGDVCP